MQSNFEIIKGIDGCYVVKNARLVKIIRTSYSENYFVDTGGWVEYELEDGYIIRV